MEMRAREETGMAQDLTPPFPPLAAALHRCFLHSHCPSCFRPLVEPPLPCAACAAGVRYCSPACFAADSAVHAASGECHLLRDAPHSSTDIRAALRLLHYFETLGLLVPHDYRTKSPWRIGGLLVGDLEEVLEEGEEMAEKIRAGGALMYRARDCKWPRDGDVSAAKLAAAEEVVLWAVLTNAVEVQVSEIGPVGVAVYGPGFSWFNHSCAPNACYRFELVSRSEEADSSEPEFFLVFPIAAGVPSDEFGCSGRHGYDKRLSYGFSRYGPRVVVRSLKPIKKGEEVCVAYTDLLQPKATRQFDLWEKYRFHCCCERCRASPQMLIDHLFHCDARDLHLGSYNKNTDAKYEELADSLDQAVAEYISNENPEASCNKLETWLIESSQEKQFRDRNTSDREFKLHPLHHLSLKAYITLASAYRTRMFDMLTDSSDDSDNFGAFKMGRAAVSYSFLLAGAVHQLFLSESSLIVATAHFLVNAAECAVSFLRSLKLLPYDECFISEICRVASYSQRKTIEGPMISLDQLNFTSLHFFGCISSSSSQIWQFLVQGFAYLEDIKSPVNFSWLGLEVLGPQSPASFGDIFEFIKQDFSECKQHEYIFDGGKGRHLLQLALHSLVYGGYLASVCYGPRCYLVDQVRNLLHDLSGL